MLARSTAPLVAVAMVFAGPAPKARAEPITFASVLTGWLISQTVTAGFKAVTGESNIWDLANPNRANVAEMKRQLDTLLLSDRANAAEIRWLRSQLDEKMDRREVEALLMKSLARVDKQLAELAQRVTSAEGRVSALEAELKLVRERFGRVEGRAETHESLTRGHGQQLTDHERRIFAAEQKIRDHEKRISELERKFAHLGAAGFDHLWRNDPVGAVAKFEEALDEDPTEPGFHYGKAVALLRQGRTDDAKRATKAGARAEQQRPPGKWYVSLMERVQGPQRSWFEDTRRGFMPVEAVSKQ